MLTPSCEAGSIVYVSGMQGMDMKQMKIEPQTISDRRLMASTVLTMVSVPQARGRRREGGDQTNSAELGHRTAGCQQQHEAGPWLSFSLNGTQSTRIPLHRVALKQPPKSSTGECTWIRFL